MSSSGHDAGRLLCPATRRRRTGRRRGEGRGCGDEEEGFGVDAEEEGAEEEEGVTAAGRRRAWGHWW
jgi:hypothetical protein